MKGKTLYTFRNEVTEGDIDGIEQDIQRYGRRYMADVFYQ